MRMILRQIDGWLGSNVFLPLFHPRLWLDHRRACRELLDMLGYDLDLEV
jgi:hypothetical protein